MKYVFLVKVAKYTFALYSERNVMHCRTDTDY